MDVFSEIQATLSSQLCTLLPVGDGVRTLEIELQKLYPGISVEVNCASSERSIKEHQDEHHQEDELNNRNKSAVAIRCHWDVISDVHNALQRWLVQKTLDGDAELTLAHHPYEASVSPVSDAMEDSDVVEQDELETLKFKLINEDNPVTNETYPTGIARSSPAERENHSVCDSELLHNSHENDKGSLKETINDVQIKSSDIISGAKESPSNDSHSNEQHHPETGELQKATDQVHEPSNILDSIKNSISATAQYSRRGRPRKGAPAPIRDIPLLSDMKYGTYKDYIIKDGLMYRCKRCPYEGALWENVRSHLRRVHCQRHFSCKFCEKTFAGNKYLKAHMKSVHDKEHQCSICHKHLCSKYYLTQHMQKQHGDQERLDTSCESPNPAPESTAAVPFPDEASLQRVVDMTVDHDIMDVLEQEEHHQQLGMQKIDPEKSDIVAKDARQFRTRLAKQQAAGGENKTVVQNDGDWMDDDESALEDSSKAESPAMFGCDQCSYVAEKKVNLTIHRRRWHEEKTIQCPKCDKMFGQKRDLKNHMYVHGDGFTCEKCGKILKTKFALQQHNARKHLGMVIDLNKRYQCENCGKVCVGKTEYTSHMNKEHLGIRPFSCQVCHKSFHRKAVLREHMKLHGDPKYSCPKCGKLFHQKPGLEVHMGTHVAQQEKKFTCEVCNKTFARKMSLTRHSRIHTGDKPYKCQLCPGAFSDFSILRRHVKGVHRLDDKNLVRKYPISYSTKEANNTSVTEDASLKSVSETKGPTSMSANIEASKSTAASPPETCTSHPSHQPAPSLPIMFGSLYPLQPAAQHQIAQHDFPINYVPNMEFSAENYGGSE